MIRYISYNTENPDDLLWVLKRVMNDITNYTEMSKQLRKAGEEAIQRLKNIDFE